MIVRKYASGYWNSPLLPGQMFESEKRLACAVKVAFRDGFSIRHEPGRTYPEIYKHWERIEGLRKWFEETRPGEPFSIPALRSAIKQERARRRSPAISPEPLSQQPSSLQPASL